MLGEELVEVCLLRGGTFEDEGDATDGCVGCERAEVLREADVRIERTFEWDGRSELNGAADAGSR